MPRFPVPFADGPISVSVNGDPPVQYTVKDGHIDAPESVAAAFNSTVSGGEAVSQGTSAAESLEPTTETPAKTGVFKNSA